MIFEAPCIQYFPISCFGEIKVLSSNWAAYTTVPHFIFLVLHFVEAIDYTLLSPSLVLCFSLPHSCCSPSPHAILASYLVETLSLIIVWNSKGKATSTVVGFTLKKNALFCTYSRVVLALDIRVQYVLLCAACLRHVEYERWQLQGTRKEWL